MGVVVPLRRTGLYIMLHLEYKLSIKDSPENS